MGVLNFEQRFFQEFLMAYSGGWKSRGPSAPVTLFWHDYETSGLDKARDRPMQFAGIRTDVDLNIIGEPTSLFCKVAPDTVPDPKACLLTGISPQRCEREGVNEAEFAKEILKQLGTPGTCGVGFNTLRFDDEVTRQMCFRTLRDPYEREWANGNSRWDIVDLARAVYAFCPSVMNWPLDEEGRVSFRLERLADANGLPKMRAHDALSDVETTIALAKLIKERAPELFHHHFGLRLKNSVIPMFNLVDQKPLFHVSGLHGVDRACAAPVIPLAVHPTQNNVFIVFDLMADPTPLLNLPASEIADRVFRAEPGQRLPLTTIYANRSPVLLTPEQAKDFRVERLGLGFDRAVAGEHWRQLRAAGKALGTKLQEVYAVNEKSFVGSDPELCLYAGFVSNDDKRRFGQIHRMAPEELAKAEIDFDNPNNHELLFRHRARNWPESLNGDEQARWENYVADRLATGGSIGGRSLDDFERLLNDAKAEPELADNPMLAELDAWLQDRRAHYLATTPSRLPSP